MIKSQKRQQGIVLFFSLIVLVLMTLIGVALAVNSGSTMATMTVASTTIDAALGVSNTLTPMTVGDVGCQRSTKASSGNLISCRRIEISSAATFGRSDMGLVTVVAGIEQEVLTGS